MILIAIEDGDRSRETGNVKDAVLKMTRWSKELAGARNNQRWKRRRTGIFVKRCTNSDKNPPDPVGSLNEGVEINHSGCGFSDGKVNVTPQGGILTQVSKLSSSSPVWERRNKNVNDILGGIGSDNNRNVVSGNMNKPWLF